MDSGAVYDQGSSRTRKRRQDYEDHDTTNIHPSDRDRVRPRSTRRHNSSDSFSGRHDSRDRHGGRRHRTASRSPASSPRLRARHSAVGKRRRRHSRPPGDDNTGRRRQGRSGTSESESEDAYEQRRKRRHHDVSVDDKGRADRRAITTRSGPVPSQAESFAASQGKEVEKPKKKPNYGNTGALAAASNSIMQADGSTVALKYHEPPEARKPPEHEQWRLFVFKGEDLVYTLDLGDRSCWLVGREPTVVDLLAEHPSVSKQHAVVQFRHIETKNEFGDKMGRVKPYLIDLESANGTELNGDKIPDRRYLEIRPKDVLKFGLSTREYVLMFAKG